MLAKKRTKFLDSMKETDNVKADNVRLLSKEEKFRIS